VDAGGAGVEQLRDDVGEQRPPQPAALRLGQQVHVQVRRVGGEVGPRRRRALVDLAQQRRVEGPRRRPGAGVALAQRRPPALLAPRLEDQGVAAADHVADDPAPVLDDGHERRVVHGVGGRVDVADEVRPRGQRGGVLAQVARAQADVAQAGEVAGPAGPQDEPVLARTVRPTARARGAPRPLVAHPGEPATRDARARGRPGGPG